MFMHQLQSLNFLQMGQAEFFEHGWESQRPLKYQDVADAIGIAQSTVWRAVQNKYADTPWGVLPLNAFFSESIDTADSRGLVVRAVKVRIHRLVEEESAERPLSEQELTRELEKQGILVSRRAVQKYRESEGIGSSRERRLAM